MNEPARFIPGGAPGPGRPKGSVGGRAAALQELDAMLAEDTNRAALREAMQHAFTLDPLKFFHSVFPLIPQEIRARVESETKTVRHWFGIMETHRMRQESVIGRKALAAMSAAEQAAALAAADDDLDAEEPSVNRLPLIPFSNDSETSAP